MAQADFAYTAAKQQSQQLLIDIYHDQPYERADMASDFGGAGFQIGRCEDVESFLAGDSVLGSDVVVLDCRTIDARRLAALAQVDEKIAQSPTHLVVIVSLDVLDGVFSVLDQSNPQILVDPSRAELVLAIGRSSAAAQGGSLREMSAEERMQIMRISQQLDVLVRRLDEDGSVMKSAPILRDKSSEWEAEENVTAIGAGGGASQHSLPDPQQIRRLISRRQARLRHFDAELFGEPAWDMLLDLSAAKGEGTSVSVTSLCIASGVPATTALRWIKQMVDDQLFLRTQDKSDGRRAFIALSEKAENAMATYFAEFGEIDIAA